VVVVDVDRGRVVVTAMERADGVAVPALCSAFELGVEQAVNPTDATRKASIDRVGRGRRGRKSTAQAVLWQS
jgi:hypothetical protein